MLTILIVKKEPFPGVPPLEGHTDACIAKTRARASAVASYGERALLGSEVPLVRSSNLEQNHPSDSTSAVCSSSEFRFSAANDVS